MKIPSAHLRTIAYNSTSLQKNKQSHTVVYLFSYKTIYFVNPKRRGAIVARSKSFMGTLGLPLYLLVAVQPSLPYGGRKAAEWLANTNVIWCHVVTFKYLHSWCSG